ncbi:MAG: WD40 repeat domain-containing protein [Anaerolineae bacterium]|nr:WD40 repeat domain-containing protein [Anaerolineae bacterium]
MKRLRSPLVSLLLTLLMTISYAHAQTVPEQSRIDQISISGDGQTLAVTYVYPYRSIIDIFDTNNGQFLETLDFAPSVVFDIDLSPHGDRVLWQDSNSNIAYYDRLTGVHKFVGCGWGGVCPMEWNPRSSLVAYGWGSLIDIYDAEDNAQIASLNSDIGVSRISWSYDGQYIASSHFSSNILLDNGQRTAVAIWNLETLDSAATETTPTVISIEPELVIENVGGGQIEFNPAGDRIALLNILDSVNIDTEIVIYDLTNQEIEQAIPLEEHYVNFAWSPDGTRLAVTGQTIRIYDTMTWEVVDEIETREVTTAIQWSPDGQHIFNNGGFDGLYVDDMPLEVWQQMLHASESE